MRAHLRICHRCFDAYQDSVILQGIWEADESVFEPTKKLVDAGTRLTSRIDEGETARESGVRPKSRARFRGRRRLGLITAFAAAVLIVAMWWLWPGRIDRGDDSRLRSTVLGPVRTAIETASMRGPFVLPGGEQSLGVTGAVFRSGFIPLNDSLESSLETLQQTFQSGDSSPDVAYWLIAGYAVTGQIDAARDLTSRPQVLHPTDPRITVLKAIIDYMDGDYERSEALLRDLLRTDPDNPIASINLAIVLHEQGNSAEARAVLSRISRDHAGTPLAKRAQSILSDIPIE